MSYFRTKRGFTLIELLVVISIIALLISILLPALQSARQNARQIQCGSQVRQMYLALTTYAYDHKGDFPRIYWGTANVFNDSSSQKAMRGYLGGASTSITATSAGPLQILVCPDRDPRLALTFINFAGLGTTYRIVAGHSDLTSSLGPPRYGWASQTFHHTTSQATPVPNINMVGQITFSSTSTIPPLSASEQPFIGDLYSPPGQVVEIYGVHYFGISGRSMRSNHEAGSNTGFADGHVAFSGADNMKRKINFFDTNALWW